MGMLIRRHRDRHEGQEAKPTRKRRQRRPKAQETPAPTESLTGSDYTELSDEQVAEAYAVTFPEGEATERDAQVTELRALNVNRDGYDSDPE